MPVPGTMADLSTNEALNSPNGADPVGTSLDNHLRAYQAILRSTNAKGADIASAATTDIGAATGEFVTVTGSTTITSLGTIDAGIVRTVHFSGAPLLTYNATSLILPGNKNYQTAAGDVLQFRSLGSGNWRCVGISNPSNAGAVTFVDTVAKMKELTALVDGAEVQTGGYIVSGKGAGRYRASTTVVAADGGSIINNNAGTISFHLIQNEPITAHQFGALGDGSTIDTAALQAWLGYSTANNKSIRITAGLYRAANLTWSSNADHPFIVGDSSGTTRIINDIDTNPVLTITGGPNQICIIGIDFKGNGSVSDWGNGNGVAGNNLVGTIPTNDASVRCIDLVHATFFDTYFTHSKWGLDCQGGIVVTLISSFAYWNAEVGFRFWKSGSSGYPNVISLRDSHAKENGQVGCYFDQGRLLLADGCDFEGNGKNTVQASSIACGVYIGSQTGVENGASNGPNGTPFHSLAASLSNCWFEQNGNNNGSGVPNGTQMAHIVHKHGKLVVRDSIFTNTTAGRNIRIDGGQYELSNLAFESALTVATNYVDEGVTSGNASLVAKNYINNCFANTAGTNANITAANCTIDATKTYFDFNRYPERLVQAGSGTTSSGTLSVTFPVAYSSAPNMTAQVFVNDSGTTTYSAEVYGITTTGATIRAKQNAAGVVTQPALTVMWTAVGT